MKHIILSSVLAAGTALAPVGIATADSTVPPVAGETTVKIKLKGSLLMLPVAKTIYEVKYTEHGYSVRADLKTSGVGALLKKDEALWAEAEGFFTENGLKPQTYVHQNLNKKARRVEVDYREPDVAVSVNPRFGSMGQPPADADQRREALDPLSGIVTLMLAGSRLDGEPCTGSTPLFDGKQRYNFRYEKVGFTTLNQSGYSGQALKCKIYYEPVAGFDPEDLDDPEAYTTPLSIFLAKNDAAGVWVPVKLEYPIGGFKAVVRATKITVTTPDG